MLRVLGVYTRLDRVTIDADRFLSDGQRLARGHAQLPFDEIESGDHLGYRVLDLQSGVHFEEKEAIFVRDELHRAGAFVTDSPRRGDGGASHGRSAIIIEAGRGRLLDHLLMTPLHRAVALEQMNGIAVPIGEHLHLDMTRMCQIALDQHTVIAEGGRGLLPCRVQCGGEFARVRHDPHAATAAAGHRLDHQREADRGSPGRRGTRHPGARRDNRATAARRISPSTSWPRTSIPWRASPTAEARRRRCLPGAGFGERGVLRQEAIAGMDGIRTATPAASMMRGMLR